MREHRELHLVLVVLFWGPVAPECISVICAAGTYYLLLGSAAAPRQGVVILVLREQNKNVLFSLREQRKCLTLILLRNISS